jgi:hypothetical protein
MTRNEKICLALIGFSLGVGITPAREKTILRNEAELIDFEDQLERLLPESIPA